MSHVCFFSVVSLSWDLKNPQIISLSSHNPEVQNDVHCIAAVKDRVWVGAGPSIFFLSAESLDCEVHVSHIHASISLVQPHSRGPSP